MAEDVELAGAVAVNDRVLQRTMVAERAGDRCLGNESYRLYAVNVDGDLEVGLGAFVDKAAPFLADHTVDQSRRSRHVMQIDQSGGFDHIVMERAALLYQKHQSAFGGDGVIDADPGGRLQPGQLECGFLTVEGLVPFGEQVGNLPRRDQHPEILNMLMKKRHRHAALVVLAQQVAHQVRFIMTGRSLLPTASASAHAPKRGRATHAAPSPSLRHAVAVESIPGPTSLISWPVPVPASPTTQSRLLFEEIAWGVQNMIECSKILPARSPCFYCIACP